MPSLASASGSCANGMWFVSATLRSAPLSASSVTLMPSFCARCIWISCSTSRSVICWRRTDGAGSGVFWSRRRLVTSATCSSTWLCSTTPSLTMTLIRSISSPLPPISRVCASAPVANPRASTAVAVASSARTGKKWREVMGMASDSGLRGAGCGRPAGFRRRSGSIPESPSSGKYWQRIRPSRGRSVPVRAKRSYRAARSFR